jgi:DNA repair protein RadD
LAHAQEVYKQLSEAGYKAAYIDGTTNAKERRQILRDAKKGRFECLVNVGVLTTGVDIPVIDTAVCLRPTKSAALWVQMIGRALRIHEGKKDCLILDFCGNVERFGENLAQPVVQEYRRHLPEGEDEEEGEGETVYKECPSCKNDIRATYRTCPYCGFMFLKCVSTPYGSLYEGRWNNLKDYDFYMGKTKAGEECVIVEYYFGRFRPLKEWLLIHRDSSFGRKAAKKFHDLKNKRLKAIRVKDLNKDFPRILAYKFEEGAEPKPISENPYEGNFYSNYGGDISF